jgi:uncharacterized protein YdeI (YjbR/CyaY-like superfamily)
MKIKYFKSANHFRSWLEKNHATTHELWVGYFKKKYKSGIYSYEQRTTHLNGPYEKKLKQNKAAWDFFYAQPPSYRKAIAWWVVSAKQEATRLKRLQS